MIRVAPAAVRSLEAGLDGLDLICIGGRKPKDPDCEKVEDSWPADRGGDQPRWVADSSP